MWPAQGQHSTTHASARMVSTGQHVIWSARGQHTASARSARGETRRRLAVGAWPARALSTHHEDGQHTLPGFGTRSGRGQGASPLRRCPIGLGHCPAWCPIGTGSRLALHPRRPPAPTRTWTRLRRQSIMATALAARVAWCRPLRRRRQSQRRLRLRPKPRPKPLRRPRHCHRQQTHTH